MDVDHYREIWIEKYKHDDEKDANKTVDGENIADYDSDDDVYDQPTASYRVDLAKHKLVWTGNFWSDMWFYTKQEHQLLSICMAEKVHPYGRGERLIIELFIFAIASMWAASVTLFMIEVHTEDGFIDFVAYYGYSLLGGVVKVVVGIICKVAATCADVQEENTRARVKRELCGYVCMAIWGIISVGIFGLGIWFVYEGENYGSRWYAWLFSLFISYLSGWVISFILIWLTYIACYRCCMKYDYVELYLYCRFYTF